LAMAGGGGFLDLERHFAFYGAYHSNPVNVFIHALFVWPIFLTALLLLHLAAPFPRAAAVFTAVYGAFYVSLDRRSGALAALLCLLCWAASSALAARLGFSVGWKAMCAEFLWWGKGFLEFVVIFVQQHQR
uniref:DUF962 domain-containing protein n=1 Tax=Aegilops tauschii subsp. strangulata TaxID=200361 RepID=A0A453GDN2_AEGTS